MQLAIAFVNARIKLKILKIIDVSFTADFLNFIQSECVQSLQEFKLQNNNIGSADSVLVMKTLSSSFFKGANFTNFSVFVYTENAMTAMAMMYLTNILKKTINLKTCVINNNNMGDFACLLGALQNCKNLKLINFCRNKVVKNEFQDFGKLFMQLNSLENVFLYDCGFEKYDYKSLVSSIVANNPNIKIIQFQNGINELDIMANKSENSRPEEKKIIIPESHPLVKIKSSLKTSKSQDKIQKQVNFFTSNVQPSMIRCESNLSEAFSETASVNYEAGGETGEESEAETSLRMSLIQKDETNILLDDYNLEQFELFHENDFMKIFKVFKSFYLKIKRSIGIYFGNSLIIAIHENF